MPDDEEVWPEVVREKADALVAETMEVGRLMLETGAMVMGTDLTEDDWKEVMPVLEVGAAAGAVVLDRHKMLCAPPVEADLAGLMTKDEYRTKIGELLNALVYRDTVFPTSPTLLRVLDVIVEGADVYAEACVTRSRGNPRAH